MFKQKLTNFQSLLKLACFPILLLSGASTIALTLAYQLNFGFINFAFLMWVMLYLAVFEMLIPYKREWLPTKSEWLRDGVYFFITMLGGGLAAMVTFKLATTFNASHVRLPLYAESLLCLVLSSLGSYVFHRASHVWLWLWRFHGIHHLEGKVNVGNNGVNHFFDVFGRRLLAQIPLVIVGFSPEAIFIVSVFNTVQGYFVHANIDVKMGLLNYIFVSPEQHRLHHSKDLSEAGHFSVDIPLWDLCFGSFTWHEGRTPKMIGVVEPKKFPSVNHIFLCMIHPFSSKHIKHSSLSTPLPSGERDQG